MSQITAQQIVDQFANYVEYASGDLARAISAPQNANTKDKAALVYIGNKEAAAQVDTATPKTAIIDKKLVSWAKEQLTNWTVLTSDNPMLAMAVVNSTLFPVKELTDSFDENKIHPTAVIHKTAQLGENVQVGPNSVISAGVTIGDNCIIGSNTTLEPKSKIGKNCHIYSQVYIGHSTEIGENSEVQSNTTIGTDGFGFAHDKDFNHYHIPHYGKVIIGKNVTISANCAIDRGTYEDTIIGDGCIFDNHCHIAHNNEFGEKCILTADWVSAGSTKVGKNFVAGGRASAAGHLSICDNVQFSAHATATKDVTEPGNYAGFPLVKHKEAIKYLAALPSLPEMKKVLNQLKKKCLED